ncbi:alpha/beta-hydrolase [Peniophora sp. CONT]|nr:alpha/beta-hydrolase [Peniophora sp. CONT]
MLSLRVPLAVALLALGRARVVAQTTVKTVDLGYATYQTDASIVDGVTSFLGIRFAAPPTGDQRFRAPQPPATIYGIQNATVQPDECMQSAVGNATTPFRLSKRTAFVQNEDCLFINVHVPADLDLTSNASLPVIAWIHGGGYAGGSNGQNPAQTLVSNSNNTVISVQMQYRLGPFGFLAGETVAKDGVLNAGLLDQQFALQWVQDHISKFGGDPSQVTIYGESAGAGSVLQHIVAHGGNTQPPLFRAAMMDSPFLPFQYEYNDPMNEVIFANLSQMVGCPISNASLDCLRSVNASELNQMGQVIALDNLFGVFTFVPVVDGDLIVERPTVTLRKNQTNSDVTLIMTNSHEGDVFVDAAALVATNSTLAEYVANLFPRMNDSSIQQAVALYSNLTDVSAPTVPEQAAFVMGDSIFVCPAFYTLDAFPADSNWKGEFAIPPGTHGSELAYLFADAVPGLTFNNSAFISSFQSGFFSTAIALNPNTHGADDLKPDWPTFKQTGKTMLFNETTTGEPEVMTIPTSDALLERCAFWLSLSDVNAQ